MMLLSPPPPQPKPKWLVPSINVRGWPLFVGGWPGFSVRGWLVCNVRRWPAFNVRRWPVDHLGYTQISPSGAGLPLLLPALCRAMGPQPWGAVPVRQPALSGRGRRGLKPPSSEEIGDLGWSGGILSPTRWTHGDWYRGPVLGPGVPYFAQRWCHLEITELTGNFTWQCSMPIEKQKHV